MNRIRKIIPFILILGIFGMYRIIVLEGQSIYDFFTNILLIIPGIIVGISFHEFGHAFASNALGDPTPKMQNRLTTNPLAHIDPFGLLALILVGFGWGRPVEIDPRYYKNPRRDEFLVAIAGVTLNLIIAFVTMLVLALLGSMSMLNSEVGVLIGQMLHYMVIINIALMIFNLIPLPPLDGFGIVTQIFDLKRKPWFQTVYRNGNILLIIVVFAGGLTYIMNLGVGTVYRFLYEIVTFIV